MGRIGSLGGFLVADRRWTQVLCPLAALLFAHLVLASAAAGLGQDPLRPATWCRGDSGHYLSIAATGYRLQVCDPTDEVVVWCGNTAWLPGYPLVVRQLRAIGIGTRPAAVGVALFFAWATLQFLWSRVTADLPSGRRVGVLLLAAFFPGVVYSHSAFPISMLTFLSLVALDGAARQQHARAVFAGMGAALTYPLGALLAPVVVAGRLRTGGPLFPRLLHAAFLGTLVLLGTAAAMLLQWWDTGAWDAFVKVQESYRYSFTDPLRGIVDRLGALWDPAQPAFWSAAQSLLVVLYLALLTVMAFRHADSASSLTLIFAALAWALPLALGEWGGLERREAVLLPLVIGAQRLPTWVLAGMLLGQVCVAWSIAGSFFSGQLI